MKNGSKGSSPVVAKIGRLTHDIDDQELGRMMEAISGNVVAFGVRLAELPSVRVTLRVEEIDVCHPA